MNLYNNIFRNSHISNEMTTLTQRNPEIQTPVGQEKSVSAMYETINKKDSSIDEQIPASEGSSRPPLVKEPLKLLIQMIYFLIIFIPFIIWAIVSHFSKKRKSIRNNVVLITGSGRGLGRGLALKFAELECKVACVDIDDTSNSETIKLIKQKYPSVIAIAYKCNIALIDDIKHVSKNISNDFGEVDIIVNNAGIVSGTSLIQSDLDVNYLNTMLDVNLKSHFLMIREFLPKMIKRNSGHIVAVASVAGLTGGADGAVYCATKHGVVGLMESLYHELRSIPNNKIQTTCICPYFIATNDAYTKSWDLRLRELSVNRVVETIIDGITKNQRIVTAPPNFYYIVTFLKLLPDSLQNTLRSIFYTHFSDTKASAKANKIDSIIKDVVTRTKKTT